MVNPPNVGNAGRGQPGRRNPGAAADRPDPNRLPPTQGQDEAPGRDVAGSEEGSGLRRPGDARGAGAALSAGLTGGWAPPEPPRGGRAVDGVVAQFLLRLAILGAMGLSSLLDKEAPTARPPGARPLQETRTEETGLVRPGRPTGQGC